VSLRKAGDPAAVRLHPGNPLRGECFILGFVDRAVAVRLATEYEHAPAAYGAVSRLNTGKVEREKFVANSRMLVAACHFIQAARS